MNKVLNINLGGVPFTIDDAAYHHLENYLQSLHNHFRESEGYEEIMGDIEARLAELMQEGIGKRSIVSLQDVKNAVSIMGKPEDFGAVPIDEARQSTANAQNTEGSKSSQKTAAASGIKTGKRLFRDPQNKMINGVCAGLAAYFGIEDVVWVRLAFVLMLIFTGTGGLLYIILWAVMPEAQSTADRLAMRGEPIDINSIAKSVEEGVEKISQKVNEFGKPESQMKFSSQVQAGVSHFSNAVGSIFSALGGVGKLIVIVVTSILVISLIGGWIAFTVSLFIAKPMFAYLPINSWQAQLGGLNGFFLFAIPTFAIVLLLRKLIFKRGVADGWHIGMWVFFFINLFSLISVGGNVFESFRYNGNVTTTTTIPNDVQTIKIVRNESPYHHSNVRMFDAYVSDDYLVSDDVHLNVKKSETGKFELVTEIHAKGASSDEARSLAKQVNYTPSVAADGTIVLNPDFVIPRGTAWRDQEVSMILYVPEGKTLRYDKRNTDNLLVWIDRDDDDRWDDDCYDQNQRAWVMTADGFICVNKDRTKERERLRAKREKKKEVETEDEEDE
jgi:phage shock protein PspC (stress-responsive transcriptional regulator)